MLWCVIVLYEFFECVVYVEYVFGECEFVDYG